MPNRILKESILASEQINQLSYFEEVVFYRLIVSADDYGCMDGRAAYLRSVLFPLKENVTKKAIEDAITKLASTDLLIPYVDRASGNVYLFLPKWGKHQRLRDSKHKYPMPEMDEEGNILNALPQLAASCRKLPQVAADCGSRTGACARAESESESEYESEEEYPPNPPQGGTVLSFADFWKAYPKKKDKGHAEKAYAKVSEEDRGKILQALEWQKKSDQWTRDGGKYIPYPATWLNGERWNDAKEVDNATDQQDFEWYAARTRIL